MALVAFFGHYVVFSKNPMRTKQVFLWGLISFFNAFFDLSIAVIKTIHVKQRYRVAGDEKEPILLKCDGSESASFIEIIIGGSNRPPIHLHGRSCLTSTLNRLNSAQIRRTWNPRELRPGRSRCSLVWRG